MIINWLVFSDLHFQFKNPKTSNVRALLLDHIKNNPAEFILILGDCFYQYKKGTEIKSTEDFIHSIVSAASCGKNNVYITPGNHDLERTELRLKSLEYYTKIDYFTGKRVDSPIPVTSDARQALFTYQYFGGFFELYKNITGKKYGTKAHKLFENENYRILNINSCVLSGGYYAGNDNDKKDLNLDEGNLSVIDEELIDIIKTIKDDHKLNIAFMHHGVEFLRKEERANFQHLMENSYIDIIFTGHSHKIGIYSYDYDKRDIKELTCGAPILDSYSEPSYFKCSFNTDSKEFTCKLYAYSNKTSEKWTLATNISVRKFDNGIYKTTFDRFVNKKKTINKQSEIYIKNLMPPESSLKEHFDKFGIVNSPSWQEFLILRNKLIQSAEGEIILVGQSLENAFDIRKDSDSIVDSIKQNKSIENIDIFLTDPIMFDTSTDVYEGDTPISRIDGTMHTILDDIALCLNENQSINIYFIPLIQLDHMIFANDILLLRHTLLWTSDNNYKATPLVCKKIDATGVDEAVIKSSMYNVYKEYINKLKEESIIIDIQEKGYDRKKETLAKIKHRQWRHRLYTIQNSKQLKGKIVMHKLYRTQLISDLHSSWDSRFRSFSSEINWKDELEESSFNAGEKTIILSHNDLYKPENLLNDSTQKIILPYVKETERLLNELVKKYDKDAFAKIYPSLDIGIPNNILRLAGGFATGMLIVWKCGTPIVPVDTTVNVCSSSYYQFDPKVLLNKPIKDFFNVEKINTLINEGSKKEGLAFSFNTGNHFLLLCRGRKNKMLYLVLHSSAKQFKDTYLGLYPKPKNWYSGYVKTYHDSNSCRYIHYLKDVEAEKFISIAKMLNTENEDIHNWFANKFCDGIHFTKNRTYHHYGMPTDYSIAIGTYVIDNEDVVPIFSREGYPIWLFRPNEKMWSIELGGKYKYIVPHGWGQRIRYNYFQGISDEKDLALCKFEIENNNLIFKDKENNTIQEFIPNYENRFSENMVEIRKLWSEGDQHLDMLKYNHYLSGTIEEVLEPIALFSKNHDEVKYYVDSTSPFVFS